MWASGRATARRARGRPYQRGGRRRCGQSEAAFRERRDDL